MVETTQPRSGLTIVKASLHCFFVQQLGKTGWKVFSELVIRRPETLPVVLSREEVAKVLGALKEEDFRISLRLIYHSGLRISEAAGIQVSDLSGIGCVRTLRLVLYTQPRSAKLELLRRFCALLDSGSPENYLHDIDYRERITIVQQQCIQNAAGSVTKQTNALFRRLSCAQSDANQRCHCMRTVIVAMLILSAATGYGCTVCDSATGEAVRAGIFNDSFFITFLEVFAPFPVLGLALYVINRLLPD